PHRRPRRSLGVAPTKTWGPRPLRVWEFGPSRHTRQARRPRFLWPQRGPDGPRTSRSDGLRVSGAADLSDSYGAGRPPNPFHFVVADRPLETPEPAEAEPMPARQRCDLFHLRQGDIPTEG